MNNIMKIIAKKLFWFFVSLVFVFVFLKLVYPVESEYIEVDLELNGHQVYLKRSKRQYYVTLDPQYQVKSVILYENDEYEYGYLIINGNDYYIKSHLVYMSLESAYELGVFSLTDINFGGNHIFYANAKPQEIDVESLFDSNYIKSYSKELHSSFNDVYSTIPQGTTEFGALKDVFLTMEETTTKGYDLSYKLKFSNDLNVEILVYNNGILKLSDLTSDGFNKSYKIKDQTLYDILVSLYIQQKNVDKIRIYSYKTWEIQNYIMSYTNPNSKLETILDLFNDLVYSDSVGAEALYTIKLNDDYRHYITIYEGGLVKVNNQYFEFNTSEFESIIKNDLD